MNFALALSGGGARGFAPFGVLMDLSGFFGVPGS